MEVAVLVAADKTGAATVSNVYTLKNNINVIKLIYLESGPPPETRADIVALICSLQSSHSTAKYYVSKKRYGNSHNIIIMHVSYIVGKNSSMFNYIPTTLQETRSHDV